MQHKINCSFKDSTYNSIYQNRPLITTFQSMSNLYRRISLYTRSSFAVMESHVQKFLNKLRPAFGLLRRGSRGTLSVKVPGDIESGLPNIIQHQLQDVAAEAAGNCPRSQSTEALGADHGDPIDLSAADTDPEDEQIEQEGQPQPQFTEGPSRFVLAKDGSRHCVALLVNEEFLAKLRHLLQEDRDLSVLDRPLDLAKMDCKKIERSMQDAQKALETAESEEQAEDYQNFMEEQTLELSNIQRWKDELEKERGRIKGNLEQSRNHTQWVLETAMRKADLLGPEKPLPAILLQAERPIDAEEEVEAIQHPVPARSSVASVTSDHSEVEVSQEELQHREAYEEFIERSQYLDEVQEKFDGQGGLYRENLAEYHEMVAAGTTNMSRSDFDRCKVQYGQQLTRALIDAEEEFEEARERAQALGAIASDYGQEFYYGAEYEESWPENKVADFNASYDWSFVEGWMNNIPDSTDQEDADSVEIDEWDAEEVDVEDSISNIDCEDYRQDIDRYRRICARLEDPCPEARWLGQPDANPLERRFSCWM